MNLFCPLLALTCGFVVSTDLRLVIFVETMLQGLLFFFEAAPGSFLFSCVAKVTSWTSMRACARTAHTGMLQKPAYASVLSQLRMLSPKTSMQGAWEHCRIGGASFLA